MVLGPAAGLVELLHQALDDRGRRQLDSPLTGLGEGDAKVLEVVFEAEPGLVAAADPAARESAQAPGILFLRRVKETSQRTVVFAHPRLLRDL